MNNPVDKIEKIFRHIKNVQENCEIIGKKLMEKGELDLGRNLIANGLIHDNSKFYGIEWEYLDDDKSDRQDLAIKQHNLINLHHPEAWHGIKNMPRLYLAEMAADISARAAEFGTDVREWIDNSATKRFKFNKKDKAYKELMSFINLLLDKPFEPK